LGLRLPEVPHRADQRICEVQPFGISPYKVHNNLGFLGRLAGVPTNILVLDR